MILSIIYWVSLLAAGSIASPCKVQSGNLTTSTGEGSKAALHRDGHSSTTTNNDQKLGIQANPELNLVSPSTNASNAISSSAASGSSGNSGTSDTSGTLTPASGSCPQGFLNTVFNTNAGQSSGFPGTTWRTLTEYGINDWSMLRLPSSKGLLAFH